MHNCEEQGHIWNVIARFHSMFKDEDKVRYRCEVCGKVEETPPYKSPLC